MGSSCCQTDLPPDSCSTFPFIQEALASASPQRLVLPPRQAAHPHTVISGLCCNSFLAICTDTTFFFFLSLPLCLLDTTHCQNPTLVCAFSTAVTTRPLSPCFPFNGTFLLCFTPSHPLSLGWSALHTSGVRCEAVSLLGLISELVFCWYLDIYS